MADIIVSFAGDWDGYEAGELHDIEESLRAFFANEENLDPEPIAEAFKEAFATYEGD